MKKKALIPTMALIAILGAISLGVTPVSAQDPTYSRLVTKIAQRFNLPEAHVQEVVNQVRDERISAAKARWEARLTKAVSDGKITEAQKALLISKHDEVRNKLESLKDLSAADRKAKIDEIFKDLEKWAQENSISLKNLGLFGGRGFRLGYRAGKQS